MGYRLEDKISQYFTIADLTKTETGVPNFPDALQLSALRRFASVLDDIYNRVGPFVVDSAFRSQLVQDALRMGSGSSSAQKQAVKKSQHTEGKAADIVPTTMPGEEFFARLLTSPASKSLGMIALKYPRKSTLHIGSPGGLYSKPTPFRVINNQYIRMGISEITDMLSAYKTEIGLTTAALAGAASFFLVRNYLKKQQGKSGQES